MAYVGERDVAGWPAGCDADTKSWLVKRAREFLTQAPQGAPLHVVYSWVNRQDDTTAQWDENSGLDWRYAAVDRALGEVGEQVWRNPHGRLKPAGMEPGEFAKRLRRIAARAQEDVAALLAEARVDGEAPPWGQSDSEWQRAADCLAEICGEVYGAINPQSGRVLAKLRKALGYTYP